MDRWLLRISSVALVQTWRISSWMFHDPAERLSLCSMRELINRAKDASQIEETGSVIYIYSNLQSEQQRRQWLQGSLFCSAQILQFENYNTVHHGFTVFHIALTHCHQGNYNLMYEIDSVNSDICLETDTMGNYMHHLVGKSSKDLAVKMAGASLLMQQELLWFKEVEKIMPAYLTKEKNSNGQTAYELFSLWINAIKRPLLLLAQIQTRKPTIYPRFPRPEVSQ